MVSDEGSAERKLLDPSELGTKEYWDALYAREITNHTDDAEDEGTVWFDESGAEEAVVKLLDRLEEEGVVGKGGAVLDLGTGNGHMLFTLLEAEEDEDQEGRGGWEGRMVGVDYSQASVDLARRVAASRSLGRDSGDGQAEEQGVRFETWDLLTQNPGEWAVKGGFGIVLDKGTFDAISLMPRPEGHEAHACEVYRRKVLPLVKDGGVLVVTSCNWTRGELVGWLVGDAVEGEREVEGFEVWTEAEYPTFSFGGRTGSSIVTLAFRKKGAGGR